MVIPNVIADRSSYTEAALKGISKGIRSANPFRDNDSANAGVPEFKSADQVGMRKYDQEVLSKYLDSIARSDSQVVQSEEQQREIAAGKEVFLRNIKEEKRIVFKKAVTNDGGKNCRE